MIKPRRIDVGIPAHRETNPVPFDWASATTGVILIYTDQEDARLEYTWRFTDPVRFSPGFGNCLSWRLASEIAIPLSVKQTLADRALVRYGEALAQAHKNHANGSMAPAPQESEIITSRE
jgi:hypothetical protein